MFTCGFEPDGRFYRPGGLVWYIVGVGYSGVLERTHGPLTYCDWALPTTSRKAAGAVLAAVALQTDFVSAVNRLQLTCDSAFKEFAPPGEPFGPVRAAAAVRDALTPAVPPWYWAVLIYAAKFVNPNPSDPSRIRLPGGGSAESPLLFYGSDQELRGLRFDGEGDRRLGQLDVADLAADPESPFAMAEMRSLL